MSDLLKMKISPQFRSATVTQIEAIDVELPDRGRISEKVVFIVIDQNKNEFKISDAWIDHKRLGRQIKGLWFETFENQAGEREISSYGALAHVMRHYSVDTLDDLVGKDIMLYPDEDDYFVIVACDFGEDESNIS